MRIGLLIYGSLDTLTGGYLYDRMMVEQLRQQEDEVLIISLPWRNYGRHLLDNGSPALFRSLRDAKLDVLIQDELNHPSLVWLNRRLKQVVSYPIVSLVHLLRCTDAYPRWQLPIYRWVERAYLNRVDGLIYNSHDSRRHVEQLIGADKPSAVAYPGKDHLKQAKHLTTAEINARATREGPLRLIFVGNLMYRKGLHTLLAALARLPKSGWQLTVIGSPDFEPEYAAHIRQQIAQNGLGENVNLLGRIPNEQIAPYLSQSQLFVMPSLYEGFGIVYVEALGFALPAIATTAGAAGEIIQHDHNGFLVPPEEPFVLAHHIRLLMENRAMLSQMSLQAKQSYQNYPTWAESTQKIRELLQHVTLDVQVF